MTPQPLTSRDRQVDEGVMIASAGVRLELKNLILERALRDGVDFDLGWFLEAIRRLFVEMAREKAADAARIGDEAREAAQREGRSTTPHDFRQEDVDRLLERQQIVARLAERLFELSDDEPYLEEQFSIARSLAADEYGHAITARVTRTPVVVDESYLRRRARQVAGVKRDLVKLQRARGLRGEVRPK